MEESMTGVFRKRLRSFPVQIVYLRKYLARFGNVRHGISIMLVAYHPVFINNELGGHAAELENLDLLPVLVGNLVAGVEQVDEGQLLFLTVVFYGLRIVRPDDQDFGAACAELSIILAQLRHVPAAVRSEHAPVENQDDVRFAAVVGKAHRTALDVGQGEVGSGCVGESGSHRDSPSKSRVFHYEVGRYLQKCLRAFFV